MIHSSSQHQKQKEKQFLANARGNGDLALSSGLQGDDKSCKKVVRYMECLRNHAAAIGGNATDGCGEFMPGGEEGTIEALNCSACNCHRNFHRKELECDVSISGCCCYGRSKRLIFSHQNSIHQSEKSCSVCSESDEKEDVGGGGGSPSKKMMIRKRFRTKFTTEQKEKLFHFAEKAGWRMQKLEESAVQQFCEEIGIKRRVLKVWMHNNKHSFAKKNIH